MAGAGITMLETPPWIIALIFTAFIVCTVIFEKIVHALMHYLQGRQHFLKDRLLHPELQSPHNAHGKDHHKKHADGHKVGGGMLAAVQGLLGEITAVGFVSLLLISFQNDITSFCGSPQHFTGKNWLDFQPGCPCCLTKTKSVTACYFARRGTTQYLLGKECENKYSLGLETNETVETDTYYKVDSKFKVTTFPEDQHIDTGSKYTMSETEAGKKYLYTKCYKGVQLGWDECGRDTNKLPMVGLKALHEIHVYIFFIAACHILVTCVLIASAYVQATLWKYWLRHPSGPQILRETQRAIDAHAIELENFNIDYSGRTDSGGLQESRRGSDELRVSLTDNADPGGGVLSSPFAAPGYTDSENTPKMPERLEIPRPRTWRGRSEDNRSILRRILRQFFPLAITKNELEVLEAAFLYTHEIQSSHQFSFMNYLQASIESDFAQMVGVSIINWTFIIAYIFLTEAIGLLLWPIMVLAGVVITVLVVKFLNLVWFMTRGGHVHKQSKQHFLFGTPWTYAHFIKFASFLVAFVFANELFFATQYGVNSCWYRPNSSRFGSVDIPWWAYFIINVWLLVVLAVVVAPLFSVVVHGGKDFKPDLMAKPLRTQLLRERILKKESKEANQATGVTGKAKKFFKSHVKPKTMASKLGKLASMTSHAKNVLPTINEKRSYQRHSDNV